MKKRVSKNERKTASHERAMATKKKITRRSRAESVSKAKRAKDQLNVDAQMAAIVESSDDAIISKDLNGIIASWNAGAERLFGYKAAEVIGKPVTILIPPRRGDEEPYILDRIRRGERVDHYETVRRRKDGSEVDISLTVSPIRDKSGKVIGASKIARDITERKRAESALAQMAAIVESSDDAIISKDLNGIIARSPSANAPRPKEKNCCTENQRPAPRPKGPTVSRRNFSPPSRMNCVRHLTPSSGGREC